MPSCPTGQRREVGSADRNGRQHSLHLVRGGRRGFLSGPDVIAALPLDSSDPERDGRLYAAMTGWVRAGGVAPVTLRHPSLGGPLLELSAEPEPKLRQNRTHLDVRPEPGGRDQAAMVELALSLGATGATEDWARGYEWVVMKDGSGNEFCIQADL